MSEYVIRTASDFGKSISGHSFVRHDLARMSALEEPEVRRLTDQIFTDLEYMEQSDSTLMSAYLDGVEEPLERLRELGFELLWFGTKGKLRGPGVEIPDWRTTHYILVNTRGYFAIQGSVTMLAHTFVDGCRAGWDALKKEILAETESAFVWRCRNSVRLTREIAVTACEHCAGRGGVPVDAAHHTSPGEELVSAAGWVTPEHSAYPIVVHMLLLGTVRDLLAREEIASFVAKLLPEVRQPEGRVDVLLARVTLLMTLEHVLRNAETSEFDRARALGVILLLGKAWGWELASSDFRVPSLGAVPMRMHDYGAKALKDLSLPASVADALARLSADAVHPSSNPIELEALVRAVVEKAAWDGDRPAPGPGLEDRKWAALRLLTESPELSIKAIAARTGLDRSHFYRDPKLKGARLLSGKDPDRIKRGIYDARTGQVDGEVVDPEVGDVPEDRPS
jgi:hypothetical protein